MTVKIVTDSAADIPEALAKSMDITVVPLSVRFGEDSYRSGEELGTEEFWKKLRSSSESPATAAPSAGDFQQAFEKLLGSADGIVSIHLSSKLSATYQSAQVAASALEGKDIHVIDTLAVSAGTGLLAIHAAERAKAGADAATIASEVSAMCDRVRLFGAIDTLEYLRRGGRIGGAQALLGTMLKVKPVISLQEGVVEPVARVRTRIKALEFIADRVSADAPAIERVAVISGDATDAPTLVEKLPGSLGVEAADVWEFGPIVGAHSGPGIVGAAYILKPEAS